MKNFHKAINYFLPVAFLLLLIFPLVNGQFKLCEFERKDENRRFTDSLHINIKKLDVFPKQAESYLNDNFSFRTPLLDFYHQIKFSYFKISPHPNKTIIGKDNWFFLAYVEKEIYGGNKDFSEETLDGLLSEWKRRKNYLDSLNIKTYWMVAPFKHYVYGEKLPFNVYASEERRVDQLKAHFEKELPDLIFDPLPLLKENKEAHKLFYQLDNHWNYHSAYLVTNELLKKIRKDFPNRKIKEIPPHIWEEERIQTGIHYSVIGIDSLSERTQTPVFNNPMAIADEKYGFKGIEDFAYNDIYELRYTNNESGSDLKVLFIRDSFARHMIPFVSEVFKESVFIFDSWRYQLNESIIETVQPDVVVFVGLETQIENMIKTYEE